jgi:hypothetical protein
LSHADERDQDGISAVHDRSAPGFGELHLGAESLTQVLEHDAVGCSKEAQDVRQKVALVVAQRGPVLEVIRQVDLGLVYAFGKRV